MKIYIITARLYPEGADFYIIGATDSRRKAKQFIRQFKDDKAFDGYEIEYEETETEDITCLLFGLKRYRVTGPIGGELTAERTFRNAKEGRVSIIDDFNWAPPHAWVQVMTGRKETAVSRAKALIKMYAKPEEYAAWEEPEEKPEERAVLLSWGESEEKPSKTQ